MKKISIKECIILFFGMFIVAASLYYIMMPSKLIIGTLSGLVLVIANFIPLKISTLTFILNIFLLLLGFLLVGKEFGGKTVVTSLLLPMFFRIFEIITPNAPELTSNILVNLLCFVLVLSFGQSLLFNINASSGGLDIVAKILNKYLHLDIGKSLCVCGFIIAASSALVYDREILIVSLLGTYLSGVILDSFINGSHVRKKLSIISPHYHEIQDFVVKGLNRGVTLYQVHGGWDNSERVELVTILQTNEYMQVLNFVHRTDPQAFITVSSVGQVIGRWNPHKRHVKY